MDIILLAATSQARNGIDLMLQSTIGSHDYVHSYVDVPIAMLIVEIMKRSEDKEEWFPHGKWGTIQAIQARIDIEINALFE